MIMEMESKYLIGINGKDLHEGDRYFVADIVKGEVIIDTMKVLRSDTRGFSVQNETTEKVKTYELTCSNFAQIQEGISHCAGNIKGSAVQSLAVHLLRDMINSVALGYFWRAEHLQNELTIILKWLKEH